MQFEVFTLLPEVFSPYIESSILQRARQRGLIEVRIHNIRDYTHDKHHTTDDTPYGGGGGMVMKPEPVFEAVESVLGISSGQAPLIPVILLTPQGRVFTQRVAEELARHERIALLCGRYEGVDERIREHLVTDEISVGDYVLTGGELPALHRHRRGLAPHPRRARRSHWRGRRLAFHGLVGVSALHQAIGVPRLEGAGGLALRGSRKNRKVAQRTGVDQNAQETPGYDRKGRVESRRSKNHRTSKVARCSVLSGSRVLFEAVVEGRVSCMQRTLRLRADDHCPPLSARETWRQHEVQLR